MFEYVDKSEYKPLRDYVESVIKQVQVDLREKGIVTFQFYRIGSAGDRHLITREVNGNNGFDLDYNLSIQRLLNNKYNDEKKMKTLFMKLFNEFKPKHFECCEDSTSVFTVKRLDAKTGNILYSFDFAIVYYYMEGIPNQDFDEDYDDPDDEYYEKERQKYIKHDKHSDTYYWELRPIATNHCYIENAIKDNNLWNELRDLYLEKKNNNKDPNKKSRIIYYETLNEIWQKYFD